MERYKGNDLESHKVDRFAHNESWTEQRRPYIDNRVDTIIEMLVGRDGDGGYARRLTSLEKFQERVVGGALVLSAMVGGGLIAIVAHLVHLI